jgi:hypothetical protein
MDEDGMVDGEMAGQDGEDSYGESAVVLDQRAIGPNKKERERRRERRSCCQR